MYIIYEFLFFIYALVYLPYLLLTRRGYKGFGMRFGRFPAQIQQQIKAKPNIWLHAVSVGEIMVLDAFMERLRKIYPDHQYVVTVTTKTGYALAQERMTRKALVLPSPIDFGFAARAFVESIHPQTYIAVETEIWPNLYRQLSQKGVPMAIINGRISDASWGRYKSVRFFLKQVLNQVSRWCMQSKRDAQRIMELGVLPNKVVVTGNVKFDDQPGALDPSANPWMKGKNDLWWVAGSTHPGEEDIVLDVFAQVIKASPSWRLIIAPRHVERAAQILDLALRRGFKAALYSKIFQDVHGQIVIVDTIGQLRSMYSEAALVFVGKSLTEGGGHNVLEPAMFGKAIIIGPKFANFRDIVACFTQGQAIVQVQDAKDFAGAVIALCQDAPRREALGRAASRVMAENRGASLRSLESLKGLFP